MSSGSCPPQEAQRLSTERCRHPQGDSYPCGPKAGEQSFWAVRASPAAPATHAWACPYVTQTQTTLPTLSPLANCPPPHPSPHSLGIGCQASVLPGFGGREHPVPKWAQWEGSSHVLLSPRLMRPQLWPSHSAPLALHPSLAAIPSASIPPPAAPRCRRAPTPDATAHSHTPPLGAGNWPGRTAPGILQLPLPLPAS